MIDRIRQVQPLCRPFGVAKENIIIIKCIYTNVNNEEYFVKASIQAGLVKAKQYNKKDMLNIHMFSQYCC